MFSGLYKPAYLDCLMLLITYERMCYTTFVNDRIIFMSFYSWFQIHENSTWNVVRIISLQRRTRGRSE